jgi:excisionase family DNA binding protein
MRNHKLEPQTEANRLGYSIKEFAAALGCSEKHVKNQIAAGTIPSIKLGARRIIPARIAHQKLEEMIEMQNGAAAAA